MSWPPPLAPFYPPLDVINEETFSAFRFPNRFPLIGQTKRSGVSRSTANHWKTSSHRFGDLEFLRRQRKFVTRLLIDVPFPSLSYPSYFAFFPPPSPPRRSPSQILNSCVRSWLVRRMIILLSPNNDKKWFYHAVYDSKANWLKLRINATGIPSNMASGGFDRILRTWRLLNYFQLDIKQYNTINRFPLK